MSGLVHAQAHRFAPCNGELDRNFDYYGGEDGGLFGHGFQGHFPDFTWWRPVKAMRMSERVYADLRNIVQNNGRYATPEQASAPGVTEQHWDLNLYAPTIAHVVPMKITRWDSFSRTYERLSDEGKLRYIKLNTQTPCPPRSAVPVNAGRTSEVVSLCSFRTEPR